MNEILVEDLYSFAKRILKIDTINGNKIKKLINKCKDEQRKIRKI